jgi:GDPmannose 4,6-dehydratase
MHKTAIITGITGQDGSYLSELLLEKEYKVIGLYRRSSTSSFERIKHLLNNNNSQLTLLEFDLTDFSSIGSIINKYHPDEFYNLAAMSHVGSSFDQPITTFDINTMGVLYILESIKTFSSATKFYQASTSEMFGKNYSLDQYNNKYQDENTQFFPQSPYAVSKVASHQLVSLYRDAYGLFCCSGILFNHEGPRRGENFLTRKVTKYIGKLINNKIKEPLKLGNLQSYRDWGHAKDYVKAMRLMLQQDVADDYVICSGETHKVLDFVVKAFENVDLDYKKYVTIDSSLYRPAEVDYLCGRSTKAQKILGWKPQTTFDELINEMVQSDIASYQNV